MIMYTYFVLMFLEHACHSLQYYSIHIIVILLPLIISGVCVHLSFSGGYCLKSSRFNELAVVIFIIIPNKVKHDL